MRRAEGVRGSSAHPPTAGGGLAATLEPTLPRRERAGHRDGRGRTGTGACFRPGNLPAGRRIG